MTDFYDISYLQHGTTRQQAAYTLLTRHAILDKLSAFDPVLAGTLPINIDIDSSDLDILCCWTDKEAFIATIQKTFGSEMDFKLVEREINGHSSVIAGFRIEDFEIELFGQAIPTRQQWGYRHMLVEHRLLTEKSESFRRQIIELKNKGYKTEPAFAMVLGLEGDPYKALLELEEKKYDEK